jgi:hypothetical protein
MRNGREPLNDSFRAVRATFISRLMILNIGMPLLSPSSSLPTIPLLHSCHLILLLTEETGPSGCREGLIYLSGRRRAESRCRLIGVRKPASVLLLWSSGLIESRY